MSQDEEDQVKETLQSWHDRSQENKSVDKPILTEKTVDTLKTSAVQIQYQHNQYKFKRNREWTPRTVTTKDISDEQRQYVRDLVD